MHSAVWPDVASRTQPRGGSRRMTKAFTSVFTALVISSGAPAVTCVNGIPASNPDAIYTVHGDGTATDTRTRLMWKVCSEGQTWSAGACTGTAVVKTWAAALADAEALVFAGHGDWRVPNLKELLSLVEHCTTNPSINASVFPSTPGGYFWSGSPNASYSSYAWLVNFYSGYAGNDNRSNYNQVRLVRGGQ